MVVLIMTLLILLLDCFKQEKLVTWESLLSSGPILCLGKRPIIDVADQVLLQIAISLLSLL